MKTADVEKVTITIDKELAEWIRDYRYARIRTTGDINFTIRQAIELGIELLKKSTDLTVEPRPANVRESERRVRLQRSREQKAARRKKEE